MEDPTVHSGAAAVLTGPEDPVPLPAMSYHSLRLLAEWASTARRDTGISFTYCGGDLQVAGQGPPAPAPEPAVYVPTGARAPKHDVASLVLAVGEASVDVGQSADALFWSEASVEKFLVPYFASCAASRADAVLAALLGAWNHYDPQAAVVAMVHYARAPEGPLALENAVGVVYLTSAGQLGVLPLGEYLAAYPARARSTPLADLPAVPAPPNSPARAAGSPAYIGLRTIAEWAGGYRDQPLVFAYDQVTGRVSLASSPDALASATCIYIPAFTPSEVPGRPAPTRVDILSRQAEGTDLLVAPQSDAVFWSTGAIEQFLFPYYASKRARLGANDIIDMWSAWSPAETAAALRAGGGGDADEEEGEGDDGDVTVYGLTHLPKSDWVPIDPTAVAPEADGEDQGTGSARESVGVLYVEAGDPDGTLRHVPLGEFLRGLSGGRPARGRGGRGR